MDFTTLISPEELNQHLEDPNWAIFDVRFDLQERVRVHKNISKTTFPGRSMPIWRRISPFLLLRMEGVIHFHLWKPLYEPSPIGELTVRYKWLLTTIEAVVLQRDYGGSCAIWDTTG
jgi:hypothetical protein